MTRPQAARPRSLYSTYVGGKGTTIPFVGSFGDIGVGIALDSNHNVYITGAAASQDFPLSVAKPPFQNSNKDTFNAFVTQFNPGCSPNPPTNWSIPPTWAVTAPDRAPLSRSVIPAWI